MTWWIAGHPHVAKTFICDKDTSHITAEFYIFNQWYGTGQNGEIVGQFVACYNVRTGQNHFIDYVDYARHLQVYHRRQEFNITCLEGDEIIITFVSPDPSNGNQRPRFRNVKVWSDALGSADL